MEASPGIEPGGAGKVLRVNLFEEGRTRRNLDE